MKQKIFNYLIITIIFTLFILSELWLGYLLWNIPSEEIIEKEETNHIWQQ